MIASFSEPVSGLTVDDFIVTNGLALDMVERPWGPESRVWDFFVTPMAEGEVTVRLPAGAVTDAGGNPNPDSEIFRITAVGAPVAIAAVSASIVEGQAATFVLTRDAGFNNPVTVQVAAGGSFAADGLTVPVQLDRFETSATFTMPSHDDDVPEAAGPLTASVVDGDTYDPGDPASASVTVTDNDLPFITMETAAASVDEAGSVTFTLTREGDLTPALTIPGTLLRSYTDPVTPPAASHVIREHPVTFPAGSATATLAISPGEDDRFFVYRQLNVRLRTGTAGLFRLRTPTSTSASDLSDATETKYHLPVTDDDPIRVAVAPRNEYVYEDEQACFTFSHNVVAHDFHFLDDPIAFAATFSQEGDFLAEAPADHTADHTVTVRADSPTHSLCLDLDDDDATEAAGSVTVAIVEDADANIVAEAGGGSATVRLLDNERPLVTLSANGADTVTEGSRAGFKLSLSAPTVVPFTVKYRIETDGDYGFEASDEGEWLYSFGPGAEAFVREVSTRNDDVDEPDGSVTVTLLDEHEYDLDPDVPAHIVLTVADDDLPAVSMTAPDDPGTFDEGDPVVLTFTREGDLTPPLTIPAGHLESSYDPDVSPGAAPHGAITFEAGSATATLTVTVDEPDGSVTVTLLDEHEYDLDPDVPAHIVLTVADDDLPAVSMTAPDDPGTFDEGDPVVLTFTREGDLTPPLTIPAGHLESSYDPDVSPGAAPHGAITFEAGSATATLTVTVEDDDFYYPVKRDLRLTLRHDDSGLFRLAAGAQARVSVKVRDDDAGAIIIGIEAVEAAVTEADQACFVINLEKAWFPSSFGPGVGYDVALSVTEAGAWLAPGTQTEHEDALYRAATPFCLDLDDDDRPEKDGSVTVAIAQFSRTVFVAAERPAAAVAVADDDFVPTLVSLAAAAAELAEGAAAEFTLTRTIGSFGDGELPVDLRVTEVGDYLDRSGGLGAALDADGNARVTFAAGAATAPFRLLTVDDDDAELEGSLTVELTAPGDDGDYTLHGATRGAIAVRSEDKIRVSVAAVSTPVTEGEDAVFRFTRTGSAEGRLSVAVQVRGHRKVMSPASRALAEKTGPVPDLIVVFEDGVTEVTQTLTTEADRYNEGDGEVVLLVEDLLHHTTELPYRISGSESAAVLVQDDDIPVVELRWITPTARLEGDTWVGEIIEGSDIDVEVACSGQTLVPPGGGGEVIPKVRVIVEHEERLNHPINTHNDLRRVGSRYPCDQDHPGFSYRHPGRRRWTGPANGLILLDLVPQRFETSFTEKEDLNARVDFSFPWLQGERGNRVQLGFRYRGKEKLRDNDFFEYEPLDEDGFATLGTVARRDYSDTGFLLGDYLAGEFVTEEFLGALALDDPEKFERGDLPEEYVPGNYEARETVTGGYLMVEQALGPRLDLLLGVRVEDTRIDYTGNELFIDPDADEEIATRPVTGDDGYLHLLPGLHARYRLDDATALRFAWTNTLARPNYYDLVPYREVLIKDEELFEGNPALDPTTSMNFDLMAERYFSTVGLVSAGLFYKDISDFVFKFAERAVTVAESFLTERREADNVDSPAVWHGPEGRHWLLSTAKSAHQLLVHDAADGKLILRVGGPGTGAGQFLRPNGVAVIGDFPVVVERDNHRLQALSLPEFEPVSIIGAEVLRRPYGIAAVPGDGGWDVWVTDNYEPTSAAAPAAEMGERLRRFRLQVSKNQLTGQYAGAYGDTTEAGCLRKVETVAVDALHGRMLVAEESERVLKVYDLEGSFTGEIAGAGLFRYEPEGLALLECGEGGGYWLATDQDDADNRFLVLDRENLAGRGVFSGAVTANTDGVALTGRGFGPFRRGAFYAVHDDGNVAAFDLAEILAALGLDCAPPQ